MPVSERRRLPITEAERLFGLLARFQLVADVVADHLRVRRELRPDAHVPELSTDAPHGASHVAEGSAMKLRRCSERSPERVMMSGAVHDNRATAVSSAHVRVVDMSKSKRLFLVHGRGFKPRKPALQDLWFNAIKHGLARDYSHLLKAYRAVPRTFVYYGDVSNRFLSRCRKYRDDPYDEFEDLNDRRCCLDQLKAFCRGQFRGTEGKSVYCDLPGYAPWKETLADLLGSMADAIGLAEPAVRQAAPDIGRYWEPDESFGSDVRCELTLRLQDALREGHDVMLVAHSLGSMIAYDVLWKFSHYCEYRELRGRGNQLSLLVTLGSPLGVEAVKRFLKGGSASGPRRYPYLLRRWENLAAEDDYVCHDETLCDDYRKMERWEMIDSIRDHRIYNLAVRHGRSNPHHGVGYLIHPCFIDILAHWLTN